MKTEADRECKHGDLFTLSRNVWTDMEISVRANAHFKKLYFV